MINLFWRLVAKCSSAKSSSIGSLPARTTSIFCGCSETFQQIDELTTDLPLNMNDYFRNNKIPYYCGDN